MSNSFPPSEIISRAIEAHGGAAGWKRLEAIDATISARGFLFTAKRRPVLDRVRMRALTSRPYFGFLDFPRPGLTGELLPEDIVRIVDGKGTVLDQRLHPRSAFGSLRKFFRWDDLDFIYFGGYATWNYLVTPFLFLMPGFIFETVPSSGRPAAFPHQVRVRFPAGIPAHSGTQVFHFDDRYLLRRIDYTAEVVGSWARAAHFCDEYRNFGGLMVPTKRWVLPLFGGSIPLPGPTLVAIDVHDLKPKFLRENT